MNVLTTPVCGGLTKTNHNRPLKRRCKSVNCGEEESWLTEHVGPENQKTVPFGGREAKPERSCKEAGRQWRGKTNINASMMRPIRLYTNLKEFLKGGLP